MYWLDILNGAARGRRKIQRRVYTAGSDLSCQLWLPEQGVAARHAAFEARNGGVLVRPMDPDAAVSVNGEAIGGERLLADGDTVTAGPVRLRYRARIHPLVQGLPILAGATVVAIVAGSAAYGVWHFIRQRAGLDRVDESDAMIPGVAIPEVPEQADPTNLATMERIGQSPRPVMSAPARTNAESATPKPIASPPAVAAPAPATSAPPAIAAGPERPPSRPTPAPAPPVTQAAPPVVVAPPAVTATQATAGATPPAPAPVSPSPATSIVAQAAPPRPPPPPIPAVVTAAPPVTTAEAPRPAPARPAPAPATPPPAPAVPKAVIALAQAEALLAAGSLDAAAVKADAAAEEDPRSMDIRAMQARIASQRGRTDEAERLWTLVLQSSAGAPLYDEAFKELIRLAEAQMKKAPPPLTSIRTSAPPAAAVAPPSATPPPATATAGTPAVRVPENLAPLMTSSPPAVALPPAPRTSAPPAIAVAPRPAPSPRPSAWPAAAPTSAPPVVSAPPPAVTRPAPAAPKPKPEPARPAPEAAPQVRISSAEVTRFPPPAEQQDFRVLEISLTADAGGQPFPSDRIAVEAVFFDRSEPAGSVFPSRAVPPKGRIRVAQGTWKPGETKAVVVPYAVPKSTDTSTFRYHGFRVRVYADGKILGEQSKPAGLPAP